MAQLERLTVRGFKSIHALEDFELRSLNVLIGANGAGKSNFMSLFRMMAKLVDQRLQIFVREQDGPDALLFGGRKRTTQLDAEFYFANGVYQISLRPAGERLVFSREVRRFKDSLLYQEMESGSGHDEALLPDDGEEEEEKHYIFTSYIRPTIAAWRVYHFNDTTVSAALRQAQAVRDNMILKSNAGNLASVLRQLHERHPDRHQRITETVQQVAPFFGGFVYRENPGERIELEWFEAGDPDTVRGPRQLSDGTLRFICLATLLLQPPQLQSDTLLLDEPELGLHPYALAVLAELLRQASETHQLIVSTQSAELISEMAPEDVVVVDRKDGASVFERLEADRLTEWLKDYSLGELWKKNVLGGRPTR